MEPWPLSNATVSTKSNGDYAGSVIIRHNSAGDPVVAQVNVGGSWVTIPWDEVVKIIHA